MSNISKLTDHDYELLNKELPVNPCNSCTCGVWMCTKCKDEEEYAKAVAQYKEAGIYDLACMLQAISQYGKAIVELEKSAGQLINIMIDRRIDLSRLDALQQYHRDCWDTK